MPPTTHARLGASSSKRWMNCPGSVALSEGMPDPTSSYAIEGTAAHELLELVLSAPEVDAAGSDTPAYWEAADAVGEYITVVVEESEDGDAVEYVEVTEDMAVAVQVAVDYVLNLVLEYGERPALEVQFDLAPLNPPEPMFGTADINFWLEGGRVLHVIDYKHGQGVVVEAEENSQVMMYALGASVAAGRVPEEVRVTIVQPRADHPDGPIRTYEFDRARLIQFKHELFAAAEATQDPDAPLAVGDWCKFCRARAVCPAQKTHAETVAMTVFSDDVLESKEVLPDPLTLDTDALAFVTLNAPLVMEWLKEVEAHALGLMEQGHSLPGLKLVRGRSNRQWNDEEGAERYLAGKGLKADERFTKKLVSPNQAEKALKARGHKTTYLEKFWEKPEGKAKLAPADDPRPALPPAAERVFGEAEDLTPEIENETNE